MLVSVTRGPVDSASQSHRARRSAILSQFLIESIAPAIAD